MSFTPNWTKEYKSREELLKKVKAKLKELEAERKKAKRGRPKKK